MSVIQAHSFLITPAKGTEKRPKIIGAEVEGQGKLFTMLSKLFHSAQADCKIAIAFNPDDSGNQKNPCRTLLMDYLSGPGMKTGKDIAQRLQEKSTWRSGLGLLFVVAGKFNNRHQLVVARFPADEGIVATDANNNLSLSFVERVFMKSLTAYKCVVYQTDSLKTGIWQGWAVDKQINADRELSEYWIEKFLMSDYRTTGEAGTRRLAIALKGALVNAPEGVRDEIWAAARMMRNQAGKKVTVDSLLTTLNLSDKASKAIRDELPKPGLAQERFLFVEKEYDNVVAFRSVELETHVRITAPNEDFEKLIESQAIGKDGRVRFTTVGKVIDKKLGRKQ